MSAKRALQQCQEAVNTRKFCYSTSQRELGGEDCLIEELTEKRCLSFMLCPKEAKDYYGSKDGDKAVCALYKEAFAFAREDARVDEGTKARSKQRVVVPLLDDCIRDGQCLAAARGRDHQFAKLGHGGRLLHGIRRHLLGQRRIPGNL